MKKLLRFVREALSLRWITGRRLVIAVPFTFLAITFLVPFLIVLRLSVTEMGIASDPLGSLSSYVDGVLAIKIKLSNYLFIAEDELYILTYLSSLKYAALTTLFCLIIGYPFAYFMARAKPTIRPTLMMLVMLPFWTSFLLRVYAWKGLSAVHDFAPVFEPGEDGRALSGSGGRPWRDAHADLLARHGAAVEVGHHRRLHARVHSCHR
jgi:putrescine transport system permease protein